MRLRSLSLLAAFAAAYLATAQDLTKPITYTTKAVTVQQALSELSQQAGVKLFIQPSLANQIIVIRLKGASLQDAMDKMAEAVGGEWKKTSDGYELDRTGAIEDKLRAEALQRRVKDYTEGLQRRMKLLQVDQPIDQARMTKMVTQYVQYQDQQRAGTNQLDWRAYGVLQNSMPDQRALYRVLETIDPMQIAEMEDGQRIVFSNKPTAMQRQIDADLTEIGETMKNEHNQFFDAYTEARKNKKDDQPNYMGGGPNDEMKMAPVRFVVAIQKPFFQSGFSLSMIGFDANNKPVSDIDGNLQLDDQFEAAMAERARLAKTVQKEDEIKLSPITTQMLGFMRAAQQEGAGSQQGATGDLRQALLHPDSVDPLAYALSEAFIGIAEARNENMVLYTDDSMFLVALFAGMDGTLKPSLVLQAVTGLGQMLPINVTEQNGWLVGAPADRLGSEKNRIDRAALGNYLRALDQNGFVSVDDTAALAITVPGYQLPFLDMMLSMMLQPESAMGIDQNNVNLLKLYASLDPSQRQRLENKESVRLADFSKEQVAILSRYVYESDHRNAPMEFQKGQSQAEVRAGSEITETSPDGLTTDCTLGMQIETSKTYFVKMSMDTFTYTMPCDLNTLAWYMYQKDHPDPRYGPATKILSVQEGEKRTITIGVTLSNGKGISDKLEDARKTGEAWTMDKLPDDLKAQLQKMQQSFAQRPEPTDENPEPPVQTAPPPVRS